MTPETCPNRDELRSFVQCSLNEQRADDISEHLGHCPKCEETVVGLERDGDTIAEQIQHAAARRTFTHEPECQQLLQSLRGGIVIGSPELPHSETPFPALQSLRDYQIVAKLGEGGMGAVYKAVHRRLKKTVALKVLPTNRIGDQATVARFEREMEVLGQLNHPHIVQAHDAGEHEGRHYLVMEYVEGCDLSDVIKRCSPLSVADACLLISQAAEGLQYAHEHGFVHRDIKPSNLMLAVTGSKTGVSVIVKILDLGLARALDQQPDAAGAAPTAELTTAGQAMGTLDYMAPEQGGDAHQVDIRADIYSLGATLYKLLTGDAPYAEHAHKPPMQRLMAIAHHEPPAIRTKRRVIPEKLAAIVHRMLAKPPERRFATPAEVVQALAPFCAGADLAALIVPTEATQVLQGKTQPSTSLATAAATSGTARRARLTWAGIAASLAVAAAIVISTRNGTVEVTAPDGGELPQDVKVVVTRGGDEVELLQADNQWSAKVVNGEYQAELRSGQDRFEMADSKLTVTRMGRSLVTLHVRKTAQELSPAAGTSVVAKSEAMTKSELSKPAVAPIKPPRVAIVERPFTVVRDEKPVNSFKTWGGVLGFLEAGDTIEVQGRGPYQLPNPPFNDLDVTIRAAAGSRPELQLTGMNRHGGSLALDGVDLVVWHSEHHQLGGLSVYPTKPGQKVQLEITRCRVQAPTIDAGVASPMNVTDSILLLQAIQISRSEANFENNVIVSLNSAPFRFGVLEDGCRMRLTNNTIVATQDHGGGVNLLAFNGDARALTKPLRIEARNNLIVMDGGGYFGQEVLPGGTPEEQAMIADWHGEGNLYCPYPQQTGLRTKDSEGKEVVVHPLDAWARRLNRTEREPKSQTAPWPHWKMAEARWSEDENFFAILRQQIEAVVPPELRDHVGPQWELIGPGEAYVRALAAAGTPVAKDDLLPEALPEGPCILLRNGQEIRGFRTLQDAVSAAISDDVIELRTNRSVGDAIAKDGNRLLTIRAAAGYSPEVGSLHFHQGCRVILEGLSFAMGVTLTGFQNPNPALGEYVRIVNCSFQTRNSRLGAPVGGIAIFEGTEDPAMPLVIRNCWIDGNLWLTGRSQQPIRLENCVVPRVDVVSPRPVDKDTRYRLEFERCAVWSPEPRYARGALFGSVASSAGNLDVMAHGTLFETSAWIRPLVTSPIRWQGTKNLFRVGHSNWFDSIDETGSRQFISGLDVLRKAFQSDADSVEAHPLTWEPQQWKLLPTSPGFQAGPDGKDMGVDVEQLTKSLGL